MSMYPNEQVTRRPVELEYAATDRSVFSFFNQVYAWMAVGLAVTACVGMLFAKSPALLQMVYGNTFGYMAIWGALIALGFITQRTALNVGVGAGTALFLLYAAVMGAFISGIFVVYPWPVIVSAVGVTAAVFAGMSVAGFVLKIDLTKMGAIVGMAVWGLIAASVINIFVASDGLGWVITYGILAAFIGLTAYYTQMLRNLAQEAEGNPAVLSRLAVVGSLMLYVAFINMFLAILRILGSRK